MLFWLFLSLVVGALAAAAAPDGSIVAPLRCADGLRPLPALRPVQTADVPQRRLALVLFAHFRDELPEPRAVPPWPADLLNPTVVGSVSHYYDTMSFGAHLLRGDIGSRRYESASAASAYVSTETGVAGDYGRLSQEILAQADRDIDFSRYDGDGPDGIRNSGDDDGVVDAVFIVLHSAPQNFLRGAATGIASLGLFRSFVTDDGPTALSAYSRAELGWARVRELINPQKRIELPDVGRAGDLYRLPLTGRGYFLLEYRTRSSSPYDRSIPGEGVLIWHVERRPRDTFQRIVTVDLECADGRWSDAGYPLGQIADPLAGADNLDFWAHDGAYSAAHGGNRGDATDPNILLQAVLRGCRLASEILTRLPGKRLLLGWDSTQAELTSEGRGFGPRT
jgi:hypothetical protein